MNHPYPHISFPPTLLRCVLNMQQLVVERELITLQHYQETWQKASGPQMPAPTDFLDYAMSMQVWVQQSLAFFGERWLFPDGVREQCDALVNVLSSGDKQLTTLLAQLRSLPAFIPAPTQAHLLTQLEAVSTAYDTIAVRQAALDERIGAIATSPDEARVWNAASPTTEAGELDQLATMISSFLTALGLGSLPVSIHPAERQVRVNGLDLVIRRVRASVQTPDWINVPGWVSMNLQASQRETATAQEWLWELTAPVGIQTMDTANEPRPAVAHAQSIQEAAIEASLWFLRRVLWQQRHIQLLPARAGKEIALDDDTLLEEQTVSVYHLVVVSQPAQADLLVRQLQQLLSEHQAHASLVDVVPSARRGETTLHFFSDDPVSEIVEDWLKKAASVIDYSLSHPTFHLTIEDAKDEN